MILSTLDEMIAERPPSSDDQRRQYAVLRGESARINSDLIALLGLYQLDARSMPLQMGEHYVQDLFDDAIAVIAPLLGLRGIEVSCICDAEVHAFCDARLVASVINNALVNALRYADGRISLEARQVGGGCVIDVIDDGPGFPPAMLARDAGSSPVDDNGHAGSTRLGLYFAAEIARLHQSGEDCGHIELTNPEGGGGCFSLHLP